jgi:hypothetical protein
MKIETPLSGVVHLKYDTQSELTHAFIRLQEFYESPIHGIRGEVFSLDNFLQIYRHTYDSNYFTDWNGFNVPGHVVMKFFDRFTNFSDEEHMLAEAVMTMWDTRQIDIEHFYLIGTWKDEDIDHEIAHALFYLNSDYKARMSEEVMNAKAFSHHRLYMPLTHWLLREGYDRSTLDDEVQAYCATNDIADWQKVFGKIIGTSMFQAAKPFRQIFQAARA